MPKGFIDRICETCGTAFKGKNLRCKQCLSNRTMKMFKYRIYPNKAEAAKLDWIIEKCRRLYNAALSGRQYSCITPIDPNTGEVISKMRYSLSQEGRQSCLSGRLSGPFQTGSQALFTPIAVLDNPLSTNKGEQSRELTEIKKTLCPEYQEINDHILRNVIERVDLAFQAFFKRNKEGVGYPRPKGKERYNSFSSDSGFKFIPRENPKRATLQLSKVGDIKIQLHRPLEGEIKRYIIIKDIDQWYVCFSCEISAPQKLPLSYEDVGIDVGIAHFAALSDGSFIENPRYYRRAEENLARLKQSLSRKRKRWT